MKKILFLIGALLISSVNAEYTGISGLSSINLQTATCDETKVQYRYKGEYGVIWDHFVNNGTVNAYLWDFKTYRTGNRFLYNLTQTYTDASKTTFKDDPNGHIFVFNRPYLQSIGRRITPGREVRHLTTSEEYGQTLSNFKESGWTFNSGSVTDSLAGQSFSYLVPNFRNISTPANPTFAPSYDDIMKYATMYDNDNNYSTTGDNRARIQCTKLIVRWCGDGLLGFTGPDGIAGTGDDEEYTAIGGYGAYRGEQCDDGNNVNGDGCSASCRLETPNVSLTIAPTSFSTSSVNGTLNSTKSSRSNYISFTPGNGEATITSGISFPTTKTYTSTATASVTVQNAYPGQIRPGVTRPTNSATATISYTAPPSSSGGGSTSSGGGSSSGGSSSSGGGSSSGGSSSSGGASTACGNGILERPNSAGFYEECDNTESWCTSSCTIDYTDPTGPGGTGGEIIYEPEKLIGDNGEVYNGGTSKPKYRNNTGYPIYVSKDFCIDREYQRSNFGVNFSGESLSFYGNTIPYCRGPVGNMSVGEVYSGLESYVSDWTGRTNDFVNEMYVDNGMRAWLDENGDYTYDSGEPNVQKIIRVAKPTVSTTVGGTSMVDSDKKSDLYIVSSSIVDPTKNSNFIVSSISSEGTTVPLSSYTIKTDNNVIQDQALVEGDNDVAMLNEGITCLFPGTYESYNGLNNIYKYCGDLTLYGTPIHSSHRTYIINGNLTINGNLNSSDSIAYVVKNGDIIISNNVTKMDGIFIAMNGDIKSNGVKTNNRLEVDGALYGNIDDLVENRTYIKENSFGMIDVGTTVNFSSTVFSSPPPLLGKFVEDYMEVRKIPTDR